MVQITSLKPGDIVWDVRKERAGNTTMRRTAIRKVQIVEVHAEHVIASWNGNPARKFFAATVRGWKRNKPARVEDAFTLALQAKRNETER